MCLKAVSMMIGLKSVSPPMRTLSRYENGVGWVGEEQWNGSSCNKQLRVQYFGDERLLTKPWLWMWKVIRPYPKSIQRWLNPSYHHELGPTIFSPLAYNLFNESHFNWLVAVLLTDNLRYGREVYVTECSYPRLVDTFHLLTLQLWNVSRH